MGEEEDTLAPKTLKLKKKSFADSMAGRQEIIINMNTVLYSVTSNQQMQQQNLS